MKILNDSNKNTRWEKNSEWLRSSRLDMWNGDYFEFLVKHVWKFNKPVRIVDFGCGIGYLGSVLLPLLPEGSSYTGLDISEILLNDARGIFTDKEWDTEFIQQDLRMYIPEEKYDIAICQTLLIHLSAPLTALEKMVRSVVPGGFVICVEPNWMFTHFGTYRHGMEVYSYEDAGIHQKWFDTILKRGVRDPYIGIKLPAMMHDLGLKNIDIRINDRANFKFQEPNKAKLSKSREERRVNRANNAEFYIGGGLDPNDAENLVESFLKTEDYVNDREKPLAVVSAMAWLVSYGEKQ